MDGSDYSKIITNLEHYIYYNNWLKIEKAYSGKSVTKKKNTFLWRTLKMKKQRKTFLLQD